MNIAVCIKQVPSSTEVRMDPVTHTIIRDGRQSVVNPFDCHALELAVSLKEWFGGKVYVVSMGIPATEALLRDAMSRGADEGLLLSDRAFAGADTLATAYTLAAGLRRLGKLDLILCGKMAVDGDTAQIGPELAENLGIPHVTDVGGLLCATPGRLAVKKSVDGGYELVEIRLPALLSVERTINLPRMPSIDGVRYGMEGPVRRIGAQELSVDPARIGLSGSPTRVINVFTPPRRGFCVQIEGDADGQTAKLAALIREVL